MLKKFAVLLICQTILLSPQFVYAEDYTDCRARCAQNQTDCLNQPQVSEPEVRAAKEAACNQRAELCFADCENLRPVNEEPGTENNPNIIRK